MLRPASRSWCGGLRRPPRIDSLPALGRLQARRQATGAAGSDAPPYALPQGARFRVQDQGRARVYMPGEKTLWNVTPRGVSVAVLGASGIMGRQVASSLAANLSAMSAYHQSTLKLVGRREGSSEGVLIGLCSEFRDAYEEVCPDLEVILDIETVKADILIMCAGASLSTKYKTETEVTRANLEIFDKQATALVANNPNAIVLVVSNPVEFGVNAFVNAGFDPSRVLGTGAYLQTLRFRREVANELGVPRQNVSGLVLGRHGLGMVPIWSSVQLSTNVLNGYPEMQAKLDALKAEGLKRLPLDVGTLRPLAVEVKKLTQEGEALKASQLVNQQPPEFRTAMRRYLTFFSGPPFARIGNAEAVCRLVAKVLSGDDTITAAQVSVGGKFLDIQGSIGVPICISGRGAEIVSNFELLPEEARAVKAAAEESQGLEQVAEAIKLMRQARASRKAKS
eukprot:TRINITY_DN65726_c0_g1_i1.p1 TRINITY_DN65726_c0_g1~~TRINITY_DN65726_c0_g1_i1.p1  ORF type:complete len:452 (+),score=82.29 TRINITY_DN65726_c0_g1_i1:158-1513(+)